MLDPPAVWAARGVEAPPDLPLDALAALVLGGVDAATLASAGRLSLTADAGRTLGALTAGRETPHCLVHF